MKHASNFYLLHNKDTEALVIINSNHEEVLDYVSGGYIKKSEGSEKDCHISAKSFWDENNVDEDLRLLSIVK